MVAPVLWRHQCDYARKILTAAYHSTPAVIYRIASVNATPQITGSPASRRNSSTVASVSSATGANIERFLGVSCLSSEYDYYDYEDDYYDDCYDDCVEW